MERKHMRVILADDHALFRRGIQSMLEHRPGVEIVGSVSNGYDAIEMARRSVPDLILMDVAMPGIDGLEATRQITEELPNTKVVMLTVAADDETLFQAIKCGAHGYLLKNLEPEQLVEMVESIARGEAPLSGAMAERILTEFRNPHIPSLDPQKKERPALSTARLSSREVEVLELLVQGKSNKEIGCILDVTENTVKNHLVNILSKLHLQNRIQAAVYAIRNGLVHVSDQQ